MRCLCCNANLTDFESTRRNARTGEYLDMCIRCLVLVPERVDTVENFAHFDPERDDLDTDHSPVPDSPREGRTVPSGAGPDTDELDDDLPRTRED